ncbi:MAG: rhomboid family intramembrane serine protease [Acidobacteria bacterium]|nr:rhomboid family intramembrane serine protease [Acidobacteriota bacterium]MBS1866964.1 rhomboid family intramembrane serine protease [Acidobacteriota bacterium]
MFIPLRDENPTRITPFINYALIIANSIVFLYEITLPHRAQASLAMVYGTVPVRFVHLLSGHGHFEATLLPLFTSMFLHAGFAHLLGNMLFLWIFGDNVEEFFGHIGYLAFYLFCGVASGLAHVFFNLHANVPAVGASGAISGVMGAYILLFPRARILTLVLIFLVPIPAFLILGYWFLLQFAAGVSSFGAMATGGVAWWAHIGGFLTGLLITAFVNRERR